MPLWHLVDARRTDYGAPTFARSSSPSYGTPRRKAEIRFVLCIRDPKRGHAGEVLGPDSSQRGRTNPASIFPTSTSPVPVVTTGSPAANARSSFSSSASTTPRPHDPVLSSTAEDDHLTRVDQRMPVGRVAPHDLALLVAHVESKVRSRSFEPENKGAHAVKPTSESNPDGGHRPRLPSNRRSARCTYGRRQAAIHEPPESC
jgi:hypothetical protein